MARPTILQYLTKGLVLCAKNFPGFTETWNYLVNATENLRGDADTNPSEGHIKVDRSNPEHPVIRLAKVPKSEGGGGGGGGDITVECGSQSFSGSVIVIEPEPNVVVELEEMSLPGGRKGVGVKIGVRYQ